MTGTGALAPFEVPVTGSALQGDYAAVEPLPEARAAAIRALDQGQTHYVPVAGLQPLREHLAHYLSRFGIQLSAEHVIVTAGLQEARFLALQGVMPLDTSSVLAARGDRQARYLAHWDAVFDRVRIAIPAVIDPGVSAVLQVRNRKAVRMPVEQALGYLPSIEAIQQALTAGSNLIYLESPGRLTGFAYSAEQVRQLSALLAEHDALCVWDQTTAPAVPDEYHSLYPAAPDRTLALGLVWPGMGLEGWQIGYVAPPVHLVEALVALKQVSSICTATLSQWAAVGAAAVFAEQHAALLAEVAAARQNLVSELGNDPRVLAGDAVNVLALFLGRESAEAVRHADENVRIAYGGDYGAPDIVRVTVKPGPETKRVVHALLGAKST